MNHEIAKLFESDMNRRKINFSVGDTVKVHYKIVEGEGEKAKERIQIYEGVVISIVNKMNDKSFNVRRVSYDIGVERIFPLYSPKISKIELVRKGQVRRAKLYFLREKSGKTARIKELRGGQAIVQAERKKEKELAQTQKDTATEAQVTAAA